MHRLERGSAPSANSEEAAVRPILDASGFHGEFPVLHARLGRVAPPLRFLLDPLVPLGPRAPPDADHCRQGASAHRRPAGAGGRAIAMPHVGSRPQPTGPLDRNSKRAATPDRVVVRPNLSGSGRPRASSDVEVAAAPPGLRPVRQPAFLLPRAGFVTAICAPRSKPRGDRARRSTFASPAFYCDLDAAGFAQPLCIALCSRRIDDSQLATRP